MTTATRFSSCSILLMLLVLSFLITLCLALSDSQYVGLGNSQKKSGWNNVLVDKSAITNLQVTKTDHHPLDSDNIEYCRHHRCPDPNLTAFMGHFSPNSHLDPELSSLYTTIPHSSVEDLSDEAMAKYHLALKTAVTPRLKRYFNSIFHHYTIYFARHYTPEEKLGRFLRVIKFLNYVNYMNSKESERPIHHMTWMSDRTPAELANVFNSKTNFKERNFNYIDEIKDQSVLSQTSNRILSEAEIQDMQRRHPIEQYKAVEPIHHSKSGYSNYHTPTYSALPLSPPVVAAIASIEEDTDVNNNNDSKELVNTVRDVDEDVDQTDDLNLLPFHQNDDAETTALAIANTNNARIPTPGRFFRRLGTHPQLLSPARAQSASASSSSSQIQLSQFDWRRNRPDIFTIQRGTYYDRYAPFINDQGNCGSCWIFAARTVLMAQGHLRGWGHIISRPSVQQMLDCLPTTPIVMEGCNGGLPEDVWSFLQANQILPHAEFQYSRKYDGVRRQCNPSWRRAAAPFMARGIGKVGTVRNPWEFGQGNDEKILFKALRDNGPMTVAIRANFHSFDDKVEILRESHLIRNPSEQYGHALTLVGLEKIKPKGEKGSWAWLTVNSWGPKIQDSTMMITYGFNVAGIANAVRYPTFLQG